MFTYMDTYMCATPTTTVFKSSIPNSHSHTPSAQKAVGMVSFVIRMAQLWDPHDNMVYVCDHDNKRIQKLSGGGTYISEFKVMACPRCLATDGTMLYVTTRDSMIIYNSNGEAIHEKPSLKAGGCMGVAVDEGHAYICNFDDNHIVII